MHTLADWPYVLTPAQQAEVSALLDDLHMGVWALKNVSTHVNRQPCPACCENDHSACYAASGTGLNGSDVCGGWYPCCCGCSHVTPLVLAPHVRYPIDQLTRHHAPPIYSSELVADAVQYLADRECATAYIADLDPWGWTIRLLA
jgi:hypothetical protein